MTNSIIGQLDLTSQLYHESICNDPVKADGNYPRASVPGKNGDWYSALSSTDLLQRLDLLANLQVPCMMYYTFPTGIVQIVSGVIQSTDSDNAHFQLVNDGNAYVLPCGAAYTSWLICVGANRPEGVVIEIYTRTRDLVVRLFSFPEKRIQAIWQDILGNPSLAIA